MLRRYFSASLKHEPIRTTVLFAYQGSLPQQPVTTTADLLHAYARDTSVFLPLLGLKGEKLLENTQESAKRLLLSPVGQRLQRKLQLRSHDAENWHSDVATSQLLSNQQSLGETSCEMLVLFD
jgi:hypothetical protein